VPESPENGQTEMTETFMPRHPIPKHGQKHPIPNMTRTSSFESPQNQLSMCKIRLVKHHFGTANNQEQNIMDSFNTYIYYLLFWTDGE
jgi:hypothetical protein